MAGIIPETQRRRFASQQVGTPGADLSTANALGAFAKASESIDRTLQKREERERKEELATANARQQRDAIRKKSVIDSRSAIGVVDFNNELDSLRKQSKNLDEYTELARATLLQRSEAIEDDEERAAFTEDASRLLISKNEKFAKDFERDDLSEIETNLNTSLDGAATNISDIFSDSTLLFDEKIDEFRTFVDMSDAIIDKQQEALGPEASATLRAEFREAFVRAAVSGLIDSSPEEVGAFLNGLGEVLPPDEAQEIREYATKVKEARIKEAKVIKTRQKNNLGTQWAVNSTKGEFPSESDIERALLNKEISVTDASSIRRLKASDKKVFLGDNSQSFNDLAEEYSTILTTETEEQTMEQLGRFRQRVMESMEQGSISQSTGAKWLKQISPKFGELMEDTFQAINTAEVPREWIWDTTAQILTDPDEIADARARFQSQSMKAIDDEENRLGRRISLTETKSLFDTLKKDFIFRLNNNRGSFQLGEIRQINGVLYKVTGYDVDGEPLLDSDLNASLQEPKEEPNK